MAMANGRKAPGPAPRFRMLTRAGLYLAAAMIFLLAPQASHAGDKRPAEPKIRELSGRFPDKPSIAPAWSIPVEPLGFAAPGAQYLGQRNALASLDFIGEDRLLFTFRVPGLLRREPGVEMGEQRQIRALVLALPSGAVQAQDTWTVHDRDRYLWMLKDGHFLLRDRNNLLEGDATLNLKPFLRFPGPLLSIGLDPDRQFLVTNSSEPVKTAAKAGSEKTSPAAASDDNDEESGREPDLVVRVLGLDTGRVMLVTRVRSAIHLPINSDGYLGGLRGEGANWTLDMNYFTGGSRIVGTLLSACTPDLDFLSERVVLATACSDMGDEALVAMTTDGEKLWTDLTPDRLVWPLLTMAPNGLRMARETLVVSHAVNAFAPLGTDDIKGQWVRVMDAATGAVALEAPASPILDAGGNVAISPSGRRVAVIDAGAIQVFDLSAPPELPASASSDRTKR